MSAWPMTTTPFPGLDTHATNPDLLKLQRERKRLTKLLQGSGADLIKVWASVKARKAARRAATTPKNMRGRG